MDGIILQFNSNNFPNKKWCTISSLIHGIIDYLCASLKIRDLEMYVEKAQIFDKIQEKNQNILNFRIIQIKRIS